MPSREPHSRGRSARRTLRLSDRWPWLRARETWRNGGIVCRDQLRWRAITRHGVINLWHLFPASLSAIGSTSDMLLRCALSHFVVVRRGKAITRHGSIPRTTRSFPDLRLQQRPHGPGVALALVVRYLPHQRQQSDDYIRSRWDARRVGRDYLTECKTMVRHVLLSVPPQVIPTASTTNA